MENGVALKVQATSCIVGDQLDVPLLQHGLELFGMLGLQ